MRLLPLLLVAGCLCCGGTRTPAAETSGATPPPAAAHPSPAQPSSPPPTHRVQSVSACQLLEQGQLRAIGRYQACASGGIDFAWSGTGLELRFTGSALRLRHRGHRLRYARLVDGEMLPDLYVSEGDQLVSIVEGLGQGEHVVRILRQGEALFGTASWLEVEISDGQILSPPPAPPHKLEIYGDSISCGYGNEGADVSCTFSAETENHYLSYGSLLARALQAEVSTIAWSGKGVAQNFARQPGPTLVDLAQLALPDQEASNWTGGSAPDAVLINLGTNDFSTEPDPTPQKFVDEYTRLITALRARYPQTFILCTVGPMLSGADLERAESAIETAVHAQQSRGDRRIAQHHMSTSNVQPGCDWHPSLRTHQDMAEELYAALAQVVVWSPPPRNMK